MCRYGTSFSPTIASASAIATSTMVPLEYRWNTVTECSTAFFVTIIPTRYQAGYIYGKTKQKIKIKIKMRG